jgi:F0F1-type ATP synthase assembly protein I
VLRTRALVVVGDGVGVDVTDPRRAGSGESGGSDESGGPESSGGASRISGRRFGVAYQGAFESVFAILIAAGIGYWLDARFDSAPIGLLGGLLVGFAAFVLRLIRLGRQLQEEARRARSDG